MRLPPVEVVLAGGSLTCRAVLVPDIRAGDITSTRMSCRCGPASCEGTGAGVAFGLDTVPVTSEVAIWRIPRMLVGLTQPMQLLSAEGATLATASIDVLALPPEPRVPPDFPNASLGIPRRGGAGTLLQVSGYFTGDLRDVRLWLRREAIPLLACSPRTCAFVVPSKSGRTTIRVQTSGADLELPFLIASPRGQEAWLALTVLAILAGTYAVVRSLQG